jgi:hypothetical protein
MVAAPVFGAPVFAAPVFGALVFGALVFGALVFGALVFAALRPGTRVTPEAHSPAACSPVCSVASAPPSATIGRLTPPGGQWKPSLRTSLSAHFLPFDGQCQELRDTI